MDDIRSVAGPIVQRYFDKLEEERQAAQAKFEAELAAKREANEKAKTEPKEEAPVKPDDDMTDAEPAVEEVE
jgi:heat shock protein 4